MPIDRAATLRNAEKLIRQGKLPDAIAEHLRLVKDQPGDWNLANSLGDLDARAGQIDKAIAQYGYIADRLNDEGSGAKAAAVYKKILRQIAGALADTGRQREAIEVLREAATLNPDDDEIRDKLLDVYFAAGDFARARECATTVEQFRMIAAALNPLDTELSSQLAKAFIARGDLATAAAYLTAETAGDDRALLLTVANMQVRGDKFEAGLSIVRRLLAEDPSRREQIAVLGWGVAEKAPEAGFLVVELAADAAVADTDWPGAAAVLQEFVTRVPNHIPALMRLVEICVDGGLESTMYSAQGQLADAYIEAGSATEARFIAEDLVAREPWEKSNSERFRRTLVHRGEPDPDEVISARLSGDSPFTSTDRSGGESLVDELPPEQIPEPDPALLEELLAAAAVADAPAKKVPLKPLPRRDSTNHHFALSANAIDLDGVLGNMCEQAAKRSGLDDVEKEYKRGLALRAAGEIDGCIQALEKASRAPKLRFGTSRLIARLYRDRDMMPQTLQWLERATQAPAATADQSHQLLYELAETHEKLDEGARDLVVFMELQSEAGSSYRDVCECIDRLTKVQAGC